MPEIAPPTCPRCSAVAKFYPTSVLFYPNGADYGPVWACQPCDTWVGCHKGTNRPLGILANSMHRRAKMLAHKHFDALWRAKMKQPGWTQQRARAAAYKWLAEHLQIPRSECHIGMMTEAQCHQVVALCRPIADRVRTAA